MLRSISLNEFSIEIPEHHLKLIEVIKINADIIKIITVKKYL